MCSTTYGLLGDNPRVRGDFHGGLLLSGVGLRHDDKLSWGCKAIMDG